MMKLLLAVFLAFSCASHAAPTIYQEQNFSIEFPNEWQKAEAPPETLALFRSVDGTKGVVVLAFKIAPSERPTALKNFVAGAKNGAIEKGLKITGERDLEINGVPFHSHSFTLPGNVVTVSNMSVAGEWGYSVQGFSGVSDPASDPEFSGFFQSFRLLAQPPVTAAIRGSGEQKSAAYKVGNFVGKIALYAFFAIALVKFIQKQSKAKKSAAP
jgi:hypothetical protein